MLIQVDLSKEGEAYQRQKFLERFYREIQDEHILEKWRYNKQTKDELGRANQGAYGILPNIGEKVRSYDARTWFRWRKEDPHFWDDKKNVEKFAKDNPEVNCTKG